MCVVMDLTNMRPISSSNSQCSRTGRQKWIRFSGYFGITPLEAFPPWRLVRFCQIIDLPYTAPYILHWAQEFPLGLSRILLDLLVYCPYSTIQLYSHTVPYSRTVVPVPYSSHTVRVRYHTVQLYSCSHTVPYSTIQQLVPYSSHTLQYRYHTAAIQYSRTVD